MPKSSARIFGYTLVELLIVVSVIGLLTGIGIVQYREYSRRQALVSATRAFVANLRSAQEDALSGKRPAAGCPYLIGYRVTINLANYVIDASCYGPVYLSAKTITFPPDITYSPSGNLTFKVLGAGTDLTGDKVITVSQTSTGKTQQITITKGGKITW